MRVIPPPNLEQVLQALYDYRVVQCLTLRQLAELIGGMTGASLCNFERGLTTPSRTNFKRIEMFLESLNGGGRERPGC